MSANAQSVGVPRELRKQAIALGRRTWLAAAWPPIAVSTVLALLVALDVWWVARFRSGYLLSTDEAGYMTLAFDLAAAIRAGSPEAFARAYQHHGPFGPLVPLLTAPLPLLFGERVISNFLVQIGLYAVLVWSSFGIGRRLGGPTLGVLTGLCVATIPAVIQYLPTYHLVLASTATFTAATFAVLESEGLCRRRWAITWGCLVGLVLLSRSYMLALVPGLVAAGVVQAMRSGQPRGRRVANLAIGVALALAIAATWWPQNWTSTLAYLTGGGADPESSMGPRAPSWWSDSGNIVLRVLQRTVGDLGQPLAAVVVLSAGVAAAAIRRRMSVDGPRASGPRSLFGDGIPVIIPLVLGYAALTSTRVLSGTGFVVPLLPTTVALGVAALAQVPWPAARAVLLGLFVAVAAFNTAVKFSMDVSPALSGRTLDSPAMIRDAPISLGYSSIERFVMGAGYSLGAVTEPLPALHKGWLPASRELLEWLTRFAGERGRSPVVFFAYYDPPFNANTLNLASRLAGRPTPTGRLNSERGGDNAEAYRHQLSDPAWGQPNFLIAGEPPLRQRLGLPGHTVSREPAEAAARSLGFQLVGSLSLPDERTAEIWWLERGPTTRS